MNDRVLLLMLLMVMATNAGAQVLEYDSIVATENSIIRMVDDSCVLIYAQETPTTAHFVFRNEQTGSTLSIPFNFGRVHDMRIFDGRRVYFCGEDFFNQGMVGMFNIRDVFYSGGVVFWQSVSTTFYDDIQVESLDRMDLFTDSGRVCMAMVGKGLFDPITMRKEKNILFSAYFDGSQWKFYCDGTKPYFIHFTDIACLEDAIVAAGCDTNGVGCYLKTYRRRMDFPYFSCTPGYGYEIPFMNPEGKVLVTKYAGNTAAVVHYDATRATVLHRVVLSGVGTISSGNVENWVTATPSYDVGGELLELATSADHSTYLLQTTDYPASGITTTMPWLVKFDHNVASTSSVQAAACYYKNQSIDVALSAMYPRSSGYSTYLVTYLPITNISTPPCKHPASLPVHYSTIGVLMPEMSEGAWPIDWPTGGAYRYAAAVNVQVICN